MPSTSRRSTLTAQQRRWQDEADRRWPDAMDMAWISGRGRWATVTWCAGLTVVLWRSEAEALAALRQVDGLSCGHTCWHDHEMVDLARPERRWRPAEDDRLARRMAHFATCGICDYVFSGKAPAAALERHATRVRGAVRGGRSRGDGIPSGRPAATAGAGIMDRLGARYLDQVSTFPEPEHRGLASAPGADP